MDEQVVKTLIVSKLNEIISEVKKAVIGKDDVIAKTLLAIIAGGHILLDDIPGVGKTTLALAFSRAMSLSYKRMQFTPDVLPADVTGFNIYNKQTGQFEYKEGAAVCSLFLADEINRTSSKTQSALLEVMEEGAVTVDGVTRRLPKPYIVIATQNPIGSVGTQMLPDSQLDRFMVKLSMGYPDTDSEIAILKSKSGENPVNTIKSVVTGAEIAALQKTASSVYADDKIYKYLASISDASRNSPRLKLGLSPRGTLAISNMAKATALLDGRDFVIPDDVRYILCDVAEHRVMLTAKAKAAGLGPKDVIKELCDKVPAPRI
jgi:MoxR-like ATPase